MITLDLDLPRHAVRGATIPIVLRVRNGGDRAAELYLQGRGDPDFDVVVRAPTGDIVWRRLDGAALQAVLQLRVLEAGESFELHDTWDQRDASGAELSRGSYLVHAILLGETEPLRSAVKEIALR